MYWTVNNSPSVPQQLLHKIVHNQNFPRREESSQLWVIYKLTQRSVIWRWQPKICNGILLCSNCVQNHYLNITTRILQEVPPLSSYIFFSPFSFVKVVSVTLTKRNNRNFARGSTTGLFLFLFFYFVDRIGVPLDKLCVDRFLLLIFLSF